MKSGVMLNTFFLTIKGQLLPTCSYAVHSYPKRQKVHNIVPALPESGPVLGNELLWQWFLGVVCPI